MKSFSHLFMRQGKIFLTLALVYSLSFSAFAQISHGGKPASFRLQQLPEKKVYFPRTPFSLTKNEAVSKQCTAFEFGKILPFNAKLSDPGFGTRTTDGEGNTIWRATITSPNAEALGLYFSNFYLPKGAKLYVYSPNKEQIIGSFTEENNSETGLFATELIFGDKLIIEYNEPASVAGLGHFTIDEILHAYRGVSDLKATAGFGNSGDCEVNVNCSEGTDYQKQRNSVVRLLIKGGGTSYWCTGSVVNNVLNDRTPYILTADHCGNESTTSELAQWIIYFNYQSATCANPTIEPTSQTMIGCSKIAASSNAGILGSDFYLILLNQDIPINYDAYFMGWDRTGNTSNSGTTIHHPQGDIKKISTYTTPLTSATYSSGSNIGSANGHWEVFWSATTNGHGVTEGGSSGSPIYSQDGFLIGTLTGGWASCSALNDPDYYGKFNYHWDKNGTTNDTQLKPWLDPTNTGALYLSGIPVGIEEPEMPVSKFFNAFPNPSNGQLILRFNETAFGNTYELNVRNMLGQSVYQDKLVIYNRLDLNLQYLNSGVYFIEIRGENKREVQKISIQ